MRICFSNQGSLRNFTSFVQTIDFAKKDELEVVVHPKWVNVHPAHLVFAAAMAMRVGKENSRISGEVPESARYLDRMGLYDFFSTPTPFENYAHKEPAGRFVPISIIRTAEDETRFVTDMIPLLHVGEKDSSIISYIVSELVRNVLEHSLARDGAIVAAQYYKKSNTISLAICDTGIGLWESLQIWHPKTDLDAIKLALTPGVSGTTLAEGGTADNAGAGLFFIRSIAKTVRSYFTIYSGDAVYTMLKPRSDVKGIKLLADPYDDRHAIAHSDGVFHGTLVAIDIALDLTEEFQTLLDNIGDVFEDVLRERKKQKYRRPNFI